ncbi:uncharacterized protein B0H64DRAFT_471719 [Chaetomium fimeti]|uniref:Uncharacterized protein n=1 Tax=Chaetomium fimeti TaxID=1854472 RepID=A0AAE0LVJ0_9PEZI|nr:hypothetical protein B0H64DRAFT_471719 [Chaetomium fimeti]
MATSMLDDVPRFARAGIESFSPEDFETASIRSIRSAAPSYTSDAPSYHSINPHPEPLPAYSPPARSTATASTSAATPAAAAPPRNTSVSSLLDLGPTPSTTTTSSSSSSTTTSTSTTTPRRYGLPPIPTGPPRSQSDIPSLARFRTPAWSPASGGAHANPTARIYQNVALRRASASASSGSSSGGSSGSGSGSGSGGGSGSSSVGGGAAAGANLDGLMRRVMLERIEEEEERRNRVRPLEDPYLVGEEAAARAREERMARENLRGGGDEVLLREDRRWDWFLAQMKDREEREHSWKRFRRDLDRRSNTRLPFRIGTRF